MMVTLFAATYIFAACASAIPRANEARILVCKYSGIEYGPEHTEVST